MLQFRVVRAHDVSPGNVYLGGVSWYRKFRYSSMEFKYCYFAIDSIQGRRRGCFTPLRGEVVIT